MVVDTLGLASGGRPRRTVTLANFCGQPSLERSGASSRSKPWRVECLFPFIGFPHADNTMRGVARRPDENHHPPVKKPYGDEAILAVVLPVVRNGQRSAREYLVGASHVETSSLKYGLALHRVELNRQELLLPH